MEKVPYTLSDFAEFRMRKGNITENEINYCLLHSDGGYTNDGDNVLKCVMPDGRRIKVRTQQVENEPPLIKDVFTHQ